MGINIVGLKRKKFTEENIKSIKNIYRKIFSNGQNISDAINETKVKS